VQQTKEIPMAPKRSGALALAMQSASFALQRDGALIPLAIAYLFCILALFALFFWLSACVFFFIPLSARKALLFLVLQGVLCGIAFVALLLPLFVGRARMAGMIAVGECVTEAELLHYFKSWHLWWRGVRIAPLFVLALLVPPFFSAPALAIGDESLPLGRALSLSVGRVSILTAIAFWGRTLLRLALGFLTLGLLWLLYDAHHGTVSYFALVMRKEGAQADESKVDQNA